MRTGEGPPRASLVLTVLRNRPLLRITGYVMAVGLAFETLQALLGLGGHGVGVFADKWDYTALELAAVGILATRVVIVREDRLAWAMIAAGLLAWTAGDLTWTLWLDGVAKPPDPSLADVFYLAMFPLTYVGLMLLIRARLHHAGAAQWLDGGVVGLTMAAAAAALVFDTVLGASPHAVLADVVNVAYPVGDFALLVFVGVAYSLSGWKPGRAWLALGAAILTTAGADIVYTYQSAVGSYVQGTVLDALWPASMCLFALAGCLRTPRQSAEPVDAPHTILVTLIAALGALGLLVSAAFTRVTPLAVGLAGGALLLAFLRAALTHLTNVRMLRSSAQEALTDALSGLGNRRRLMLDLQRILQVPASSRPATLLFFDLNGFKRYNDTFGHAAGDALLSRLGAALSAAVAGQGRAYRLGGDEFCVLLEGRYQRHDRFVAAASSALVEQGTAFTVTASLGVAVLPDDAATASAALQLADERMYADKARAAGAGRAQARDVLMALLSERTPGLHEHVTGVGDLARRVGLDLELDGEQLDEVQRAAELHDIGKLAIPDQILNKPGPLTESEWKFMREHPAIGERILSAAPALRPVARLVRSSHERWDGTGYPDRLAGERIPLGARIVSVCDAFEAMTSERCYQRARSEADAIAELQRCAGTQFDPRVVAAAVRALVPEWAAAGVSGAAGSAIA